MGHKNIRPAWKQDLISGYHEFRVGAYQHQKNDYMQLGVDGQNPKVLVISCADSRVNPAAIFNARPGELFSLRNVANIVPPYDSQNRIHGASATIEYAVTTLNVEAIMVMGHENCGGIQAYLDGLGKTEDTTFIGPWISLLDQARMWLTPTGEHGSIDQKDMEFAGIMQSIDNLMTFPFVAKAVEEGKLSLLGSYFSIIQGILLFADENGEFQEVPTKA